MTQYTIDRNQVDTLAQGVIERLCVEGTRNAGGRYTRSDGETLQRRVAKILAEELAILSDDLRDR